MSDGNFQTESYIPRDKDIIKELVRDENLVEFAFLRDGKLYYNVPKRKYLVKETEMALTEVEIYQFPIPLTDTDGGVFYRTDKAFLYMKWIRKAFENQELIKI